MKLQTLNIVEDASIKSAILNPRVHGVSVNKTAAIARPSYRARRSGKTHVKPGDIIFWTQPVQIFTASEIGGREGESYAYFGFNGPEKANNVGLIPISVASRAPKSNTQARVGQGAEAQHEVFRYIKRLIRDRIPGVTIKFISLSAPGSQEPDIVIEVNGKRIQFEVKHRTGFGSLVTVFNKFVRRGETNNPINNIVKLMTGRPLTFEKLIDIRRKKDKSQGFPGDEGVVNISGKFSPLTVDKDSPKMKLLTDYLLPLFTSSGDNYFVLHYGSKNVKMFFTGEGENILDMPTLDSFDLVKLDTYGTGYNGAIRMAVKVRFPSVVSEGVHLMDFAE